MSTTSHETYIMLNLVGKKLGILEAQLEAIMKAPTIYRENAMLSRIGYAALSYYEIVTDAALRSRYSLPPPYHKGNSLAFSPVKSMSLVLETQILSSNSGSPGCCKEKGVEPKGISQEVLYKVHTAIVAYSRQLQLQEKLSNVGADYYTCLDCIESALQNVQVLKSIAYHGHVVDRHLKCWKSH